MSGTLPKAIKYIDHEAIAREFIEVFSFIYDYHSSRLNNHTRQIEDKFKEDPLNFNGERIMNKIHAEERKKKANVTPTQTFMERYLE
jgi:hypothetical protein